MTLLEWRKWKWKTYLLNFLFSRCATLYLFLPLPCIPCPVSTLLFPWWSDSFWLGFLAPKLSSFYPLPLASPRDFELWAAVISPLPCVSWDLRVVVSWTLYCCQSLVWLTIPGLASQFFHHLYNHFPGLNSICFKYFKCFLFSWLDPS